MPSKFEPFEADIVKRYLFHRETISDIRDGLLKKGMKASCDGLWKFIRARRAGWAEKASELWDRAERREGARKASPVPALPKQAGDAEAAVGKDTARSYFENEMRFGVKGD